MTQTTILALQSMDFGRKNVMVLSLSLEVENNYNQKSLGNSNHEGVFIGLPIGLKWLKSIKGWLT